MTRSRPFALALATATAAALLGAGEASAQAPAASAPAKPAAPAKPQKPVAPKPAAAKPSAQAAKPAAARPATPAGKPVQSAPKPGPKPAGKPVQGAPKPGNAGKPGAKPTTDLGDQALQAGDPDGTPGAPSKPSPGDPSAAPPVDPNAVPAADPNDPNAAPAGDPDDDPRGGRNAQQPDPVDPLAIPPEAKDRMGVGDENVRPGAVGPSSWRLRPYYETRGDYRLRLVPPLYLEHTRGLPQKDQPAGTVSSPDTEGLYGLLYYRRRSLHVDADVVFPLAWRFREDQRSTLVLGPFVHQEDAKTADHRATHANWFAPLLFEAKQKDGGYFHLPIALTLTAWSKKHAFTMIGTYFRRRDDRNVDEFLFPLFLHADNHDQDGARTSFTLAPLGLFYKRDRELDDSHLTVIGPVFRSSTPKRNVFDVLPFFWHIQGKPETGGVQESHTTLLPFFHYGRSEDKSLFVLPGYLRRVTRTSDTMLSPFVSFSTGRKGKTSLFAAGPVVPLVMRYKDLDTGLRWTGVFPFVVSEHSPRGYTLATPLFATDKNYGVNHNTWVFPNVAWGTSNKGWHAEFVPVVWAGRSGQSSHAVVAPLFWDFASPKSRTTIGFPVYWRFANPETRAVTQVVGNTVYVERHVRGGQDWQVHVVPVFSYGKSPTGHFWNVLFGLAGYTKQNDDAYVRVLWIPFHVKGGKKTAQMVTPATPVKVVAEQAAVTKVR